jgi:hypothetical protein
MVSSIIYAIAILVTAVIFYSLDLFVFKEGTEKSQDLSEVKHFFKTKKMALTFEYDQRKVFHCITYFLLANGTNHP